MKLVPWFWAFSWKWSKWIKELGELSELQIRALLPTLTLGLSLVKVVCCPVIRQETGMGPVKSLVNTWGGVKVVQAFSMFWSFMKRFWCGLKQKTILKLEHHLFPDLNFEKNDRVVIEEVMMHCCPSEQQRQQADNRRKALPPEVFFLLPCYWI